MKTFTNTLTLTALLSLFSGIQVAAQDESGAHDGLLPLTTIPLTNQAGSTTGSETLFATAVTTSTLSGGGFTTIYSDLSGIVTGTATSVPTASVTASTVTAVVTTATTGSASNTISTAPGVTVLSSSGKSTTVASSGSSGTVSSVTTTSASGTKSASSTSSSASANASGTSGGDKLAVGGLGVVGAVVAGLFVI